MVHHHAKYLLIFIICCLALCLRNFYFLIYALVPLAWYIWEKPKGQVDKVQNCANERWFSNLVKKWEDLGGPYYLHNQVELIEYLSKITDAQYQKELVRDCSVFLREITSNNKRKIQSHYQKCVKKDPKMAEFLSHLTNK